MELGFSFGWETSFMYNTKVQRRKKDTKMTEGVKATFPFEIATTFNGSLPQTMFVLISVMAFNSVIFNTFTGYFSEHVDLETIH